MTDNVTAQACPLRCSVLTYHAGILCQRVQSPPPPLAPTPCSLHTSLPRGPLFAVVCMRKRHVWIPQAWTLVYCCPPSMPAGTPGSARTVVLWAPGPGPSAEHPPVTAVVTLGEGRRRSGCPRTRLSSGSAGTRVSILGNRVAEPSFCSSQYALGERCASHIHRKGPAGPHQCFMIAERKSSARWVVP